MHNVMFTFKTSSEQQRFVRAIRASKDEAVLMALSTMVEDAGDYSLFVSGRELYKGTLQDIEKKFQQETASHSAVVEIRQKVGNKWNSIKTRRLAARK